MTRLKGTHQSAVPEISRRLRILRATTGLSQQKFATTCGLEYRQWNNFEQGSRIGIDAAMSLAKHYGLSLDWIYLGNPAGMPYGIMEQIKATDDPHDLKVKRG